MHVHFLLGPAGSGKTFRCLAEIRAELQRAPDGPPLILLAPKQATFQLERQLLGWGERPREPLTERDAGSQGRSPHPLAGYARLWITSFERLATHVLDELRLVPPPALNEEGRVMVLRALLLQHAAELKRFHQSARRPGFAQQLSALLAELQSHQLPPAKLSALAQRRGLPDELQAKLHDLALLSQAYADWLEANELQDANHLLQTATDALREKSKVQGPKSGVQIAALWLDGFAEMTPGELDLLAAVLPGCERATLAFCLDHEPPGEESWLSIWAVVGKTFLRCRERVAALKDVDVSLELLKRDPAGNRFSNIPALAHLEAHWSTPCVSTHHAPRTTASESPIRLTACATPDAEAALAARAIVKFVRAGGRFREAAVLVRSLDGYHKPIARTFRRYGVPYFLDRREGVAHHPLAELTRGALRTVAFDWQHEDWFAALKAGFCPVAETALDRLENEALARGWRGAKWRTPFEFSEDETAVGAELEALRQRILPPFTQMAAALAASGQKPTGRELAAALRQFWSAMKVEERLEDWAHDGADRLPPTNLPEGLGIHSVSMSQRTRAPKRQECRAPVHSTVFTQMLGWLDNVALAFAHTPLPVRDWLPVLEAGLANLTVGVIPPALDQVLIGAIDRSRNPDLKLALVLGLNDGVFPAAPASPLILSASDRDELESRGVGLGSNLRDRLAHERYFGYIACTRASERLLLTWSAQDASGRKLNASPFVSHLRRLFPALEVESFARADWPEAERANELTGLLLGMRNPECGVRSIGSLREIPTVAELDRQLAALRNQDPKESLSPELAGKIYGNALNTSVSRLEQFAACPFRFFVHSGLRAEERKVFELDAREQGSFQHQVLQAFHEQLRSEGKQWRDITAAEARELVGKIANGLLADYREGLLRDSPQTEFTARVLTRALQDFIEVLVGWMHTRYQFDPAAVELAFGEGGEVPAWTLELGGGRQLVLRGRIDRVDLHRGPGADAARCVVIDYKSGQKKFDAVLVGHGVQLQLLSYLNVLRQWPAPGTLFGVSRLAPAGVFYVNLRGGAKSGHSRAALAESETARKIAFRHTGRFDASALDKLDASGETRGEQFNFRLTKEGVPYANSAEAMSPAAFGELLARVEAQLRFMGERILAGEAAVSPYRKGTSTPCDFCEYSHVCRIDPWTHEYRVLRAVEGATEED